MEKPLTCEEYASAKDGLNPDYFFLDEVTEFINDTKYCPMAAEDSYYASLSMASGSEREFRCDDPIIPTTTSTTSLTTTTTEPTVEVNHDCCRALIMMVNLSFIMPGLSESIIFDTLTWNDYMSRNRLI